MIYRDRIYYFRSKKDLEKVLKEPKKWLVQTPAPKDLKLMPKIFIIGKPKTGKTTLADMLASGLDVVKIDIAEVLRSFLERPEGLISQEAATQLRLGNVPREEVCLELLRRRLQQRDCQTRGYVLDGFPKTIRQAKLM